jgi:hypothetical protein
MDEDYVMVNPAVRPHKFNAVVMRFDHTSQEYVVFRISEALPESAARALAQSWAAAMHMEVR